MIFKENIQTSFKTIKEFYNPFGGDYCVIPNGFGVKDNNYINSNKTNCLIYNWMIEDNIIRFNKTKKEGTINLQSVEKYEKYIYFLSLIYRSYIADKKKISTNEINNSYYSHLKRIRFSEENPDEPIVFFAWDESQGKDTFLKQMLGMSSQYIREMVNFFIYHEILLLVDDSKYVIDWTKGENRNDRKARSFIVDRRIFREPSKFKFTNERIKRNLAEKRNKDIEESLKGDDVVNFENTIYNDEMIQRFTFPTMDRLIEVANKMVQEGATDKHGRRYVWEIEDKYLHPDNGKEIIIKLKGGKTKKITIRGKLIENCPVVDIRVHLYSYYLWMSGNKVVKKRKIFEHEGETFYDRFYSILSILPKWIRNEIKMDEEEVVEVDATALHSRIVGKMFSEWLGGEPIPEFLTGDSHSKIAEILNISRQEAKIIALSYWNSRIVDNATISNKKNITIFRKMDNLLKTQYPELWNMLIHIKCVMTPIKGHNFSRNSNMSAFLIDREVRIMQDVISRIEKQPVIYIYDALAVGKSKAEDVQKIFNEVLEEHLEVSEKFLNLNKVA